MTDLEEMPDQPVLEIACKKYAVNLYAQSLCSSDSVGKFFYDALNESIADRVAWRTARQSVIDFAIDSYIFHRRHKEQDDVLAKRNALVDTYGYMMGLANDRPIKPRAMRDNWW